jgi:hypothetical protein
MINTQRGTALNNQQAAVRLPVGETKQYGRYLRLVM